MSKVNGEQLILDMIGASNQEYQVDADDFVYEYLCEARRGNEALKAAGYAILQQEGGGEGGAEDCFVVFSFKDKIYKMEYEYSSYGGYDVYGSVEGITEVKPVQVTVTHYQ